jgi:hypothetical protein
MSESEEELKALRSNHLDTLWERYFITRRPHDLASYIDAGGDIDDVVREAISGALRGKDSPVHGSRNVLRDIEFFFDVKARQHKETLDNKGKKVSLEEVRALVAGERDMTESKAKAMYDRGREDARDRLGISKV